MKLQILVPQYKETEDIIKPLLDSIEIQQNVDLKNEVGVIIVNDGSDVHLSRDFLDRYTYRIDYYLHGHNGVSATRNACLDYATADYVMFCDADDMFYRIDGLYTIFCVIEKGFDLLNPNFMQEIRDKTTGKAKFIVHPRNCTHVHGKVLRRQFLLDNKIRWNERLTIHEDGYFNTLCQRLAKSVVFIQNPFYLWKWNAESVTRQKPHFLVNTYEHFVATYDALADEFLRRGKKEIAQELTTAGLFNFYFMANSHEWTTHESEEHRTLAEKSIKDFCSKFRGLYETISTEEKNKVFNRIQDKMRKRKVAVPSVSLERWLAQIGA